MRRLVIAGFLVILTCSGCASMKATSASAGPDVAHGVVPPESATPSHPPPAAATPIGSDSATSNHAEQSSAAAGTAKTATAATAESAAVASAAETDDAAGTAETAKAAAAARPSQPSPASTAAGSSSAKAKSPTAIRPAKVAGAATAQPRPTAALTASAQPKAPPPSASAPSPASPTLNLADLEQRLRDTRAIGVFTKLSLKNQVDDLLSAFRSYYRESNKSPPMELRQRYDLLLLKVLTLLQDSDPPLAAAISSSREAIWSILADPDKFAKI